MPTRKPPIEHTELAYLHRYIYLNLKSKLIDMSTWTKDDHQSVQIEFSGQCLKQSNVKHFHETCNALIVAIDEIMNQYKQSN